MSSPTKWRDTPAQAEARTAAILSAWKKQTDLIPSTISEVMERELWKLKYPSPREWLEDRCGITRQWANQVLSTQRTIEEIQGSAKWKGLSTSDPENKAILQKMTPEQRKKLDGLPTEQKAEVFQKSVEAAGGLSPTPKLIEQVRKETVKNGQVTKKEKPTVELDAVGCPIPEEALEFWHRAQEIQDMMTAVQRIKGQIEKARNQDDHLYRAISQSAIDHLSRVYQCIGEAKPYAVCLYCQGHWKMNKGCRNCREVGVVSKWAYEKNAPEELRVIREKSIQSGK